MQVKQKGVTMKLVLLMAMMLVSSVNFAAVGQNNMTVTVGGNMNYTSLTTNVTAPVNIFQDSQEFLGGGFDITLGHLYLSQGSLIHGFDTKIRFAMNFSPISKMSGIKVEAPEDFYMGFDTTTFSVGTTYIIGSKIGNGRLMFDVLGLNIGYLTGAYKQIDKSSSSPSEFIVKTGNNFLVSIELPLGTRYIFDNGLTLGFSHRLDFAFGGELTDFEDSTSGGVSSYIPKGSLLGSGDNQLSYLAYNLTFSLGYLFGK